MFSRLLGKSNGREDDAQSQSARRKHSRRSTGSISRSDSLRKSSEGKDKERHSEDRRREDGEYTGSMKERNTEKPSRVHDEGNRKRERRVKRDRNDKDGADDGGFNKSRDGYDEGITRGSLGPNEVSVEQVRSSGFGEFPDRYNLSGVVGGPPAPPVLMSDRIPDQFPGQFPVNSTAPYRPPLSANQGGPGLAAEYYGDGGQSVSQQPGVRPQLPFVRPPQTQISASAGVTPTGPGAASAVASSFNGSINSDMGQASLSNISTTNNVSAPFQQQYVLEPIPTYPPGSIKPDKIYQSSSAPAVATLGAAAAGAAVGYMVNNTSHQYQSGSTSNSAGGSQRLSHPPQNFDPASTSAPPYRPEKYSHQPSAIPLYAAGGAGATGVVASTSQHNNHNHSALYQPSAMAHQHRHRGPLHLLVDFFKDPEGVAKFEEYSEYIGVCKDCFSPGSSPRDAPRKHHYRYRRSKERRNSGSRIDKDSRYWSSDSESQRKSKGSWLTTAVAGYGVSKIAEKIFSQSYGLDDTYTFEPGRDRKSPRSNIVHRSSSSPDRRDHKSYIASSNYTAHQRKRPTDRDRIGYTSDDKVSRKDGRGEVSGGPSIAAYKSRHQSSMESLSRSKSRHRKSGLVQGIIGAALASSVLAPNSRRQSRSPPKEFVKPKYRNRGESLDRMLTSDRQKDDINPHSRRPSPPRMDISKGRHHPVERSKIYSKDRKKTRSSNSSIESSSNEGLIRSDDSIQRRRALKARVKEQGNADAALAIAGASILASNRIRRNDHPIRTSKPIATKKSRPDQATISRSDTKSRKKVFFTGSEENQEAFASDSEYSSADSNLAYGGREIARRKRSQDSFSSDSSVMRKWGWRWGSKKDRVGRPREKPTTHDGHSQHSGPPFIGILERPVDVTSGTSYTSHARKTVSEDKNLENTPLQHVIPLSTSDQYQFDAALQGSAGIPNPLSVTSRPDPVPIQLYHTPSTSIQHPQPIAPLPTTVYNAQPFFVHSYSDPTSYHVFSETRNQPQYSAVYGQPENHSYIPQSTSTEFPRLTEESNASVFKMANPTPRRTNTSPVIRSTELGPPSPHTLQNSSDQHGSFVVNFDKVAKQPELNCQDDSRQKRECADVSSTYQHHVADDNEPRVNDNRIIEARASKLPESDMMHQETFQSEESPVVPTVIEIRPREASSSTMQAAVGGIVTSTVPVAKSVNSTSHFAHEPHYDQRENCYPDGSFITEVRQASPESIEGHVATGIRDLSLDEEKPISVWKAAAQISRRNSSHEDYGSFFAPPELKSNISDHRTTAKDTASDMDSTEPPEIITIEPKEYHESSHSPAYSFAYSGDEGDISPLPWVPKLNLIAPTPIVSRSASMDHCLSPVREPDKAVEFNEPPESRKASKVTWGGHETIEYTEVTPIDHHDEFIDSSSRVYVEEADLSLDRDKEKNPNPPAEETKLKTSEFDPSITIDKPALPRHDSHSDSEGSSHQSPHAYQLVEEPTRDSVTEQSSYPQGAGFVDDDMPSVAMPGAFGEETPVIEASEREKEMRNMDFGVQTRGQVYPGKYGSGSIDGYIALQQEATALDSNPDVSSERIDSISQDLGNKEINSQVQDVDLGNSSGQKQAVSGVPSSLSNSGETHHESFRDHGLAGDVVPEENLKYMGSDAPEASPVADYEDGTSNDRQKAESIHRYESPPEDDSSIAPTTSKSKDDGSKKSRRKSKRKSSGLADTVSNIDASEFSATGEKSKGNARNSRGELLDLYTISADKILEPSEAKAISVDAVMDNFDEPKKKKKSKDRKSSRNDGKGEKCRTEDAGPFDSLDGDENIGNVSVSGKSKTRRQSAGDSMTRESGRNTQDIRAEVYPQASIGHELPENLLTDPKGEEVILNAEASTSKTGDIVLVNLDRTPQVEACKSIYSAESPPSQSPLRDSPNILDSRQIQDSDTVSNLSFLSEVPLPELDSSNSEEKQEPQIVSGSRPVSPSSISESQEIRGSESSTKINTKVEGLTSSPTAVPLKFRLPPLSPGSKRSLSSTPYFSLPRDVAVVPPSQRPRPRSTEFKSSNEFRPLWLLETNSPRQESSVKEIYPSLPSSHSSSRSSSVRDHEEYAQETVATNFGPDSDVSALVIDTSQDVTEQDLLGSQQTTPTAPSYQTEAEEESILERDVGPKLETGEISATGEHSEPSSLSPIHQSAVQNIAHDLPDSQSDLCPNYAFDQHEVLPPLPSSRASSPDAYREPFMEDPPSILTETAGSSIKQSDFDKENGEYLTVADDLIGDSEIPQDTDNQAPYHYLDIFSVPEDEENPGHQFDQVGEDSVPDQVPESSAIAVASFKKGVKPLSAAEIRQICEQDAQDAVDSWSNAPNTSKSSKKNKKDKKGNKDRKDGTHNQKGAAPGPSESLEEPCGKIASETSKSLSFTDDFSDAHEANVGTKEDADAGLPEIERLDSVRSSAMPATIMEAASFSRDTPEDETEAVTADVTQDATDDKLINSHSVGTMFQDPGSNSRKSKKTKGKKNKLGRAKGGLQMVVETGMGDPSSSPKRQTPSPKVEPQVSSPNGEESIPRSSSIIQKISNILVGKWSEPLEDPAVRPLDVVQVDTGNSEGQDTVVQEKSTEPADPNLASSHLLPLAPEDHSASDRHINPIDLGEEILPRHENDRLPLTGLIENQVGEMPSTSEDASAAAYNQGFSNNHQAESTAIVDTSYLHHEPYPPAAEELNTNSIINVYLNEPLRKTPYQENFQAGAQRGSKDLDIVEPLPNDEDLDLLDPLPKGDDLDLLEPLPDNDDLDLLEPLPGGDDLDLLESLPEGDDLDLLKSFPADDDHDLSEHLPENDQHNLLEPLPGTDDLGLLESLPADDELDLLEPVPADDDLDLLEPLPADDDLDLLEPLPTVDDHDLLESLPGGDDLDLLEHLSGDDDLDPLKPLHGGDDLHLPKPLPGDDDLDLLESLPRDDDLDLLEPLPEGEDLDLLEPLPGDEDLDLLESLPESEDLDLLEPLPGDEDLDLLESLPGGDDLDLLEPLPDDDNDHDILKSLPEKDDLDQSEPRSYDVDLNSFESRSRNVDSHMQKSLSSTDNLELQEPVTPDDDLDLQEVVHQEDDLAALEPLPSGDDLDLLEPSTQEDNPVLLEPLPPDDDLDRLETVPPDNDLDRLEPLSQSYDLSPPNDGLDILNLLENNDSDLVDPQPNNDQLHLEEPVPKEKDVNLLKSLPGAGGLDLPLPGALPSDDELDLLGPLPADDDLDLMEPVAKKDGIDVLDASPFVEDLDLPGAFRDCPNDQIITTLSSDIKSQGVIPTATESASGVCSMSPPSTSTHEDEPPRMKSSTVDRVSSFETIAEGSLDKITAESASQENPEAIHWQGEDGLEILPALPESPNVEVGTILSPVYNDCADGSIAEDHHQVSFEASQSSVPDSQATKDLDSNETFNDKPEAIALSSTEHLGFTKIFHKKPQAIALSGDDDHTLDESFHDDPGSINLSANEDLSEALHDQSEHISLSINDDVDSKGTFCGESEAVTLPINDDSDLDETFHDYPEVISLPADDDLDLNETFHDDPEAVALSISDDSHLNETFHDDPEAIPLPANEDLDLNEPSHDDPKAIPLPANDDVDLNETYHDDPDATSLPANGALDLNEAFHDDPKAIPLPANEDLDLNEPFHDDPEAIPLPVNDDVDLNETFHDDLEAIALPTGEDLDLNESFHEEPEVIPLPANEDLDLDEPSDDPKAISLAVSDDIHSNETNYENPEAIALPADEDLDLNESYHDDSEHVAVSTDDLSLKEIYHDDPEAAALWTKDDRNSNKIRDNSSETVASSANHDLDLDQSLSVDAGFPPLQNFTEAKNTEATPVPIADVSDLSKALPGSFTDEPAIASRMGDESKDNAPSDEDLDQNEILSVCPRTELVGTASYSVEAEQSVDDTDPPKVVQGNFNACSPTQNFTDKLDVTALSVNDDGDVPSDLPGRFDAEPIAPARSQTAFATSALPALQDSPICFPGSSNATPTATVKYQNEVDEPILPATDESDIPESLPGSFNAQPVGTVKSEREPEEDSPLSTAVEPNLAAAVPGSFDAEPTKTTSSKHDINALVLPAPDEPDISTTLPGSFNAVLGDTASSQHETEALALAVTDEPDLSRVLPGSFDAQPLTGLGFDPHPKDIALPVDDDFDLDEELTISPYTQPTNESQLGGLLLSAVEPLDFHNAPEATALPASDDLDLWEAPPPSPKTKPDQDIFASVSSADGVTLPERHSMEPESVPNLRREKNPVESDGLTVNLDSNTSTSENLQPETSIPESSRLVQLELHSREPLDLGIEQSKPEHIGYILSEPVERQVLSAEPTKLEDFESGQIGQGDVMPEVAAKEQMDTNALSEENAVRKKSEPPAMDVDLAPEDDTINVHRRKQILPGVSHDVANDTQAGEIQVWQIPVKNHQPDERLSEFPPQQHFESRDQDKTQIEPITVSNQVPQNTSEASTLEEGVKFPADSSLQDSLVTEAICAADNTVGISPVTGESPQDDDGYKSKSKKRKGKKSNVRDSLLGSLESTVTPLKQVLDVVKSTLPIIGSATTTMEHKESSEEFPREDPDMTLVGKSSKPEKDKKQDISPDLPTPLHNNPSIPTPEVALSGGGVGDVSGSNSETPKTLQESLDEAPIPKSTKKDKKGRKAKNRGSSPNLSTRSLEPVDIHDQEPPETASPIISLTSKGTDLSIPHEERWEEASNLKLAKKNKKGKKAANRDSQANFSTPSTKLSDIPDQSAPEAADSGPTLPHEEVLDKAQDPRLGKKDKKEKKSKKRDSPWGLTTPPTELVDVPDPLAHATRRSTVTEGVELSLVHAEPLDDAPNPELFKRARKGKKAKNREWSPDFNAQSAENIDIPDHSTYGTAHPEIPLALGEPSEKAGNQKMAESVKKGKRPKKRDTLPETPASIPDAEETLEQSAPQVMDIEKPTPLHDSTLSEDNAPFEMPAPSEESNFLVEESTLCEMPKPLEISMPLMSNNTEEVAPLEPDVTEEVAPLESGVPGEVAPLELGVPGEVAPLESGVTEKVESLESDVPGEIASLKSNFTEEKEPLESKFTEEKVPLKSRFTNQEEPLELNITEEKEPSELNIAKEFAPLESNVTEEKEPLESNFSEEMAPFETSTFSNKSAYIEKSPPLGLARLEHSMTPEKSTSSQELALLYSPKSSQILQPGDSRAFEESAPLKKSMIFDHTKPLEVSPSSVPFGLEDPPYSENSVPVEEARPSGQSELVEKPTPFEEQILLEGSMPREVSEPSVVQSPAASGFEEPVSLEGLNSWKEPNSLKQSTSLKESMALEESIPLKKSMSFEDAIPPKASISLESSKFLIEPTSLKDFTSLENFKCSEQRASLKETSPLEDPTPLEESTPMKASTHLREPTLFEVPTPLRESTPIRDLPFLEEAAAPDQPVYLKEPGVVPLEEPNIVPFAEPGTLSLEGSDKVPFEEPGAVPLEEPSAVPSEAQSPLNQATSLMGPAPLNEPAGRFKSKGAKKDKKSKKSNKKASASELGISSPTDQNPREQSSGQVEPSLENAEILNFTATDPDSSSKKNRHNQKSKGKSSVAHFDANVSAMEESLGQVLGPTGTSPDDAPIVDPEKMSSAEGSAQEDLDIVFAKHDRENEKSTNGDPMDNLEHFASVMEDLGEEHATARGIDGNSLIVESQTGNGQPANEGLDLVNTKSTTDSNELEKGGERLSPEQVAFVSEEPVEQLIEQTMPSLDNFNSLPSEETPVMEEPAKREGFNPIPSKKEKKGKKSKKGGQKVGLEASELTSPLPIDADSLNTKEPMLMASVGEDLDVAPTRKNRNTKKSKRKSSPLDLDMPKEDTDISVEQAAFPSDEAQSGNADQALDLTERPAESVDPKPVKKDKKKKKTASIVEFDVPAVIPEEHHQLVLGETHGQHLDLPVERSVTQPMEEPDDHLGQQSIIEPNESTLSPGVVKYPDDYIGRPLGQAVGLSDKPSEKLLAQSHLDSGKLPAEQYEVAVRNTDVPAMPLLLESSPNRDSAIHVTDSPRLPDRFSVSYVPRDSGYHEMDPSAITIFESVAEKRRDEFPEESNNPTGVDSAENQDDQQLYRSLASGNHRDAPIEVQQGDLAPVSRTTLSSLDINEERHPPNIATSLINPDTIESSAEKARASSPVSPTTKDRSSALFQSSPSSRDDFIDQHTTRQSQPSSQVTFDQAQPDSWTLPQWSPADVPTADFLLGSDAATPAPSIFNHSPPTVSDANTQQLGGLVGPNDDDDRSTSRSPFGSNHAKQQHRLDTIIEYSPEESPLQRTRPAVSDSGSPQPRLRSRRVSTSSASYRGHVAHASGNEPAEPFISTEDIIARLSWPSVDDENHSVDLDRSRSRNSDKVLAGRASSTSTPGAGFTNHREHDDPSVRCASVGSVDSIPAIIRTPDQARSVSGLSQPSSGTPPLRRTDRSVSGDLRLANKLSRAKRIAETVEAEAEPEVEVEARGTGEEETKAGGKSGAITSFAAPSTPVAITVPSSSTYDPVTDKGKRRLTDMTDVYVSSVQVFYSN